MTQILDKAEVEEIMIAMYHSKSNVLVHCAQGKSRSAVICICFLAVLKPTVSIKDIVKEVQSRRSMAEPNHGFLQQLIQWQRDGFFEQVSLRIKNQQS